MIKFSEWFNYDNIGGKIKNLAKCIFIVGTIATIVAGVILFFITLTEGVGGLALFIILAIPIVILIEYVSTWFLYAFGALVEDIHAMRYDLKVKNIDKNVQLMANPMIREAEEKAKREAEARAKREAEEKAKREAEARAKCEAEEKAKTESLKKEKPLAEKLGYALLFESDEGMIRYLKDIQDEAVQVILQSPKNLIREQIKNLLSNM